MPDYNIYPCGAVYNSVNQTLGWDHSNDSYRAALSFGTVYYPAQHGSDCLVYEWRELGYVISSYFDHIQNCLFIEENLKTVVN